jgi:hypothetical protein
VVDDGQPVAGARVVFHTASGAIDALVVADANGIAERDIEAGSLVTVAYPNDITLAVSRIQLLTFTDLDPGDDLTIEIPSFSAGYAVPDLGPTVGSLRIELPPTANAGSYTVHLGCTDVVTDQLITVIDVPEACLGTDDKVDLTVDAYTQLDVPYHLGTTYAGRIPISSGTVTDVTLPEWLFPVPTIDVEVIDIPDGATNAVTLAVMLADGQAFEPVIGDIAPLTGGPATLSPGFLTDFAEQMDLEVRLNAGVANISTLFLLSAPVAQTTQVSDTWMLPTVRDIAVNDDANEISWTTTGDLSNADATFVYFRSERREGVVTRQRRWIITTPPSAASPFVLPELPAELDAYRPLPGDDYLDPGIVTFDVDWIGGYDSFVADHGTGFLDDPCVPTHSTARLTRTGVFYGPRLTTSTY